MPDCLDGPRLARLFADGSWTQLWTEPEWSQKHAGVGALVLFRGCFGPGSARTWGGQSPARALDLGQRGSAGRNRVISCPKILSLSSLENVRVATRCCVRWRILPPGGGGLEDKRRKALIDVAFRKTALANFYIKVGETPNREPESLLLKMNFFYKHFFKTILNRQYS